MKAVIRYSVEFTIPKLLPHAKCEENDNTIFRDTVGVRDGYLQLDSHCGNTRFQSWTENEDSYIIPSWGYAHYDGAWGAMNAVWGITFPECKVGQIESSYGKYQTLAHYEFARNILDPLKRALVRSLGERATPGEKKRLANVEPTIGQILDLNDPCRNPIIQK